GFRGDRGGGYRGERRGGAPGDRFRGDRSRPAGERPRGERFRCEAGGHPEDRGAGRDRDTRADRFASDRPSRDERDRGAVDDHEVRDEAPALSEEISERDLDPEVRAELRSLSRPVADRVARHLVAAGQLIDDDPDAATAHAGAARRLAPRVPAVREAAGLSAYRAGQWQPAMSELRAYHRMTGRQTHLAVLADCERALGRPERAIDLYRSVDRGQLGPDEAAELLIVVAGARADLGQYDAAIAMLQDRE